MLESRETSKENNGLVGMETGLELSEIVAMQQLLSSGKLFIYEGEENSADELLFLLEGRDILIEGW